MHHHQHPHALDMGNNFDHEEGSSNMKNRFDSESESAALDNLLTLFPSSQNREADACSEASSYSCKDDQLQQQNESSSNNTTPSPAVTTSPAVNVKTLFDQLLLAGLVGGGDSAKSGNGSIPGLETPKAISKETSKAEEEDASKNKKDGDEEKENKETNAVKREEALEEKKVKSEIPEIKDINLASRDLASILKM